jgi:hypothetical protein
MQSVSITIYVVSSNPGQARCTRYIMWKRLSVTCDRSLCTPVSFTNKTDRHNITEMFLKVALSIIKPTNQSYWLHFISVFINMTIRFEQVKETYNYKDDRFIFLANIGTLSVGLVACLGVFLASNFQVGFYLKRI